MHNAVYWPNTDWLTSGPVRKRSDSSLVQTRDVQRKKKEIKDQKLHYEKLAVAAMDTSNCF